MNNVLYQRTLVPANVSPDGESPTIVYVTSESNGTAVFLQSPEGTQLLKWFAWDRNQAIEYAVGYQLEDPTPKLHLPILEFAYVMQRRLAELGWKAYPQLSQNRHKCLFESATLTLLKATSPARQRELASEVAIHTMMIYQGAHDGQG